MTNTWNLGIALALATLLAAPAFPPAAAKNVEFTQKTNQIDVTVDGKAFTSYIWSIDPAKPMFRPNCVLTKPILFPVYSPSGRMITRGYPLLNVPGEAQDHPHHMGIYFTVDINDEHFWGNSAKPLPRIQHIEATEIKGGQGAGTLSTISRWIASDNKPMLEEKRTMTFLAPDNADYYAIDLDITLTAVDRKVVIGDTKEGMMAIRVAPWLKEDGGGRYLNSDAAETEKNVWGKRAKWMRLQGVVDGKTYGVTILNHPDSTNYPTFWHARAYGCFTANPLGQGAFEKSHKLPNAKNLDLTIEPGQSALFKHRMVIYKGMRNVEQINAEFADYTSSK